MTAPTRSALSALSGQSPAAAKWNAALHPRGRQGKFRSVLSRVVTDLVQWAGAGAPSTHDPLAAYTQPQLRSAAVALGLGPATGTRHSALKTMLMAQATSMQHGGSVWAPVPSGAPSATKVSKAVAGIHGVTALQIPVPPVGPGQAAWMAPKTSIELHLNGTKIGTLHQYSWGWEADTPAGNRVPGQGNRTKTAAVQALVAHHQTTSAAASSPAGPPAAPGRFVPMFHGSVATAMPNGVTAKRWARPFRSYDASFDLYYGGVHIGTIHESRATNDWIVGTTGPRPGLPHEFNEHDAAEAVLDEYKARPWPSSKRLAPVATRIQEAIDRHVVEGGGPNDSNDPLAGFTHRQLVDLARKHNLPRGATVSRRQLSSSLVQTLAPKAPPAAAAPSVAHAGAAPTVDPIVRAAQDVLYGLDPKGKTASRQLAVYGAMRRPQFDSLSDVERSTVMGDLAYIGTTSKGPNAKAAQKLIDRFAPPGTPPGTIPKPTPALPAHVTSAQHRVADPTGTAGLLGVLPTGQRGSSGDGWTRTASGGSGPWGQYGAAGLMLRHVDANGEERFLMIERGPGISDPGKWQFPGGAKDQNENFYQGAARETVEELGFTAADLAAARVHGTHTHEAPGVTVPGLHGAQVPWAYVSIAATVPTQLKPDLSTHHARMETSDARWMTRAEIAALDSNGKLLRPLAGGQLEQNVMSLFPPGTAPIAAPTPRPPRLTGTPSAPAVRTPHKPSRGVDLIFDQASKDKLRQDVKQARGKYAGKVADDRLAAIGATQGYDDTPTVVTKAEMDRLLATGDYIEAWRGVQGAGSGYRGPGRGGAVSSSKTAAQIQEEFRTGPAYYGIGMYGNGYYFATQKHVADGYSDGTKGSVIRVLIPKSAKTEHHPKVEKAAHAASSASSKAKGQSHEDGTLYDEGRYAAAIGLDGIEIPYFLGSSHVTAPGKSAYNIVNRSVLIVQEA